MKDLNEYKISFIGLKEGNHEFKYQIDNKFFEYFEYSDFFNCDVNIVLKFLKKSTLFELEFIAEGKVKVACDVTNELYDETIKANFPLIVKFGNEFNDENEEILVIPHSEHQLDLSQYIYELIVLAIPIKRIHPGVADGTLKSDILDKLEELKIKDKDIPTDNVDPRWEILKEIITDKKA